MNRDELKVGQLYYYFNFETTSAEFLQVRALHIQDRNCLFETMEIYISRYKDLGQRILPVSKIYRGHAAALKKVGSVPYLGRYVFQSIFENGKHNQLGMYVDGEARWAYNVWKSAYRRK
jgi:hypothetical protein